MMPPPTWYSVARLTAPASTIRALAGSPAARRSLAALRVGARAARVERAPFVAPDPPRQRLGADDAGGRARLDDVHRPRRRRLPGHEAPARLQDEQGAPGAGAR